MIAGIGNDIVRIVRIEQALQRHGDAFARKVLGDLRGRVVGVVGARRFRA